MKLHINNLSAQVKDSEVKKMFEKYGTVASVVVVKNRRTELSKGYAFVVMHDRAEAEAAIAGLNEHELNGNNLVVGPVLPKTKVKSSIDTDPKTGTIIRKNKKYTILKKGEARSKERRVTVKAHETPKPLSSGNKVKNQKSSKIKRRIENSASDSNRNRMD